MIYQKVSNIRSLQKKFQKVCRQLHHLLEVGSYAATRKVKLLIKRREHYLKQLMSANLSPVRTGSALAVAMLLSAHTHAQQCNQYNDANAANPIIQAKNKSYSKPFFVDIDGDGDLDCYLQSNAGRKPVFFKNVGTKTVPYYIQDDIDGGFQNYTDPEPGATSGNGPQFADLDGDGDMDCFIPEGYKDYYSPKFRVIYYENIGTSTKPLFRINHADNPLKFLFGFDLLNLRIADMDNDGDYDLFNSDYYSYGVYSNNGTKTKPNFQYVISGNSGRGTDRVYYDYNKDGLADYFEAGHDYKSTSPFNYVSDPDGPTFSGDAAYYLQTLADINGDGVPDAFDIFDNFLTITPVPVIHSFVSGTLMKLVAAPRDSNDTYQWQRNGKDIPVATKDILFTSIAGLYTVKIRNTCGTGVSLPYKLNTSAASFADADASTIQFTKTLNTVEQPLLKAYPNPFTQQFSLNFGDSYSANTLVKITDVQGRMISTSKANNSVMQLGGNLQKGVYVVQVIQDNAVVFTQKIIKE